MSARQCGQPSAERRECLDRHSRLKRTPILSSEEDFTVSTLGPTSVGTSYGITQAVVQTRGVGFVAAVPSVGCVSGDLPASASQAPVAAGPGVTTAIDEISQEAALVDGAIAMPARPLAEIIWQLRASVNAGRGAVRASRAQPVTRDGTQPAPSGGTTPDDLPNKAATAGGIKVAARAYSAVQTLGLRRTPVRSVDVYTGKK